MESEIVVENMLSVEEASSAEHMIVTFAFQAMVTWSSRLLIHLTCEICLAIFSAVNIPIPPCDLLLCCIPNRIHLFSVL